MFITSCREDHITNYISYCGSQFKKCENITEGFLWKTWWSEIATDHEKSPQWRAGFLHSFLCVECWFLAVTWGFHSLCAWSLWAVSVDYRSSLSLQEIPTWSSKHLHIHPYSSTASWLMPYQWMLQLGPWTFNEF